MLRKIEFSVRRNLAKYPFTPKMKLDERVKLMLSIYKATCKYESELAGKFYRLKHIR
jgi:hypothetical protein